MIEDAVQPQWAKDSELKLRAALYTKKRKARDAIKDVGKAGHNKAQNYDFARAEDFIKAVEEAIAPHNLCVDFDVVETSRSIDPRPGKYDNLTYWTLVSVTCEATLTDCDTGYSQSRSAVAEANDTGDKATSKANTQARKLALQNLFNLMATDDLEADESVDEPHGKPQKAAKPTSKPAAKPSGKGGLGKAHMDAINKAIESRAGEISVETSAMLAHICNKLDVKTIDLIPTERVGKLVVAVTKGEFDPAVADDDDIPF